MWPRRGADLAPRKIRVFCARSLVLRVYIGRASNSAQNESSHASGAADTAENGPERTFLKENAKNRKRKCDDLSRRLKRKAFAYYYGDLSTKSWVIIENVMISGRTSR